MIIEKYYRFEYVQIKSSKYFLHLEKYDFIFIFKKKWDIWVDEKQILSQTQKQADLDNIHIWYNSLN